MSAQIFELAQARDRRALPEPSQAFAGVMNAFLLGAIFWVLVLWWLA